MKPSLVVEMLNHAYNSISGIEYFAYYFQFAAGKRLIILSKDGFNDLCAASHWKLMEQRKGDDWTLITLKTK